MGSVRGRPDDGCPRWYTLRMIGTRHLLGYDVRAAPKSVVDTRWSLESRERYLLRPETKFPLAASTRVWPSIFGGTDDELLDPTKAIRIEPGHDWYFDAFGYWNDLEEMLTVLGSSRGRDCGIAICVVSPEGDAAMKTAMTDDWLCAVLNVPRSPATPSTDWAHLGYDVADMGEISAVCDCGIVDPKDREAWRPSVSTMGGMRE